jgi:hypothetical protein
MDGIAAGRAEAPAMEEGSDFKSSSVNSEFATPVFPGIDWKLGTTGNIK